MGLFLSSCTITYSYLFGLSLIYGSQAFFIKPGIWLLTYCNFLPYHGKVIISLIFSCAHTSANHSGRNIGYFGWLVMEQICLLSKCWNTVSNWGRRWSSKERVIEIKKCPLYWFFVVNLSKILCIDKNFYHVCLYMVCQIDVGNIICNNFKGLDMSVNW